MWPLKECALASSVGDGLTIAARVGTADQLPGLGVVQDGLDATEVGVPIAPEGELVPEGPQGFLGSGRQPCLQGEIPRVRLGQPGGGNGFLQWQPFFRVRAACTSHVIRETQR